MDRPIEQSFYEDSTNDQRPIMNDLEDVFNQFILEELSKLDDLKIQIDYEDKNMSEEEFDLYERRIESINDDIDQQKDKLFTEFAREFYFGVKQVVSDIQNRIPRRIKDIGDKINHDNLR